MHPQTGILILMLLSYGVAIAAVKDVVEHVPECPTVSCALRNPACNTVVTMTMTAMCIFTLIYEWNRDDPVSFGTIVVLLVGIYGVLYFDET